MKRLLIFSVLFLFAGIVNGQTLNKGAVISPSVVSGILKPDASMNQVVDFLQKTYKPLCEEALEGITVFVLKGDRGKHEHLYGVLIVSESLEIRNKYWPEEGEFREDVLVLHEQLLEGLMKYFITLNGDTTDWVIL